MKRKASDYLMVITIAILIMIIGYVLAESLKDNFWSGQNLTIDYLKWLAIIMTGAVAIFREISIWEINTNRLKVHSIVTFSDSFSISLLMQRIAWGLAVTFLALIFISLINPIHAWVEELLGGPIILWLTMLISFVTLLSAAIVTNIFWETMSKKNNPKN